jgi:hypothetical protein
MIQGNGRNLLFLLLVGFTVLLALYNESKMINIAVNLSMEGEEDEKGWEEKKKKDDENERRNAYIQAFPSEYTNTNHTYPDHQSFEDLQNRSNLDIPVPRNLNILLSGDSLTRYQYLDLAYFLAHGKWINASETPNMVFEKDFDSWVEFYNFTNTNLQPYEECDCHRDEKWNQSTLIENRYFLDIERNNSLTYLQKFGDSDYTFSWDPSDVHNPHGELPKNASQLNITHRGSWVNMIPDYICQMNNPKPSVFIFNSGLWTNKDLVNETIQDEIIDALNKCDIKSIFKTTTKMVRQRDRQWKEYENQLCNKTDHCYDLSWTGVVPTEMYWDKMHFRAPTYSYMNIQLLSLLSSNDEIKV